MPLSANAIPEPKVVVVIDDELDNVELTVLVLQSAGHAAYGVTGGAAGIQLAEEVAADVVVLDYQMPFMNGAVVGNALRANPPTRDVKILMCSGTGEDKIRATFRDYDAFLAKPVDGLALLETVAAL